MFDKLLGGRKRAAGQEPTRPAGPTPGSSGGSSQTLNRPRAPARTPSPESTPAPGQAKSFDPYNSGAFERKNAWERISRR